jgi:hypothetical protein
VYGIGKGSRPKAGILVGILPGIVSNLVVIDATAMIGPEALFKIM